MTPGEAGVGGDITTTPNPSALSPSTGDEYRFSSHGFLRAPMRIGVSSAPSCPKGTLSGGNVYANGMLPGTSVTSPEFPCSGAGQSTTQFHSPMLPDDQYLSPSYTRNWEKDWVEVFLNYGNSHMVGTVGFQAYGLTDAEHLTADNIGQQLGISQAYVTLTPSLGSKFNVNWKVGSYWDKYGMSGKYDAGKYDMYLFGRTHVIGQTLSGEYTLGKFRIRAAEGFGVHEETLEFNVFTPASGTFPGLTMLAHAHVGASYKQILDINAHYMVAFAQDNRALPLGVMGETPVPDGKESVAGIEGRLTGGVAGELYLGYSHVSATAVEGVGPALETIASLGGYGQAGPNGMPGVTAYYGANGLMDNYLGTCAEAAAGSPAALACKPSQVGTGSIDSILLQYDYSFGLLWRKLKDPHASFWGEGPDVTLNLFGLYQAISSTDTSQVNPLVGNGVKKLKYGTDIIVNPISWFGFGVRGDVVQPTSLDAHESFGVISPKLIFRSRWVTHEEITVQYSHYWYGSDVLPQPPNETLATGGTKAYGFIPDANVFGAKATMWW